MKKLILDVKPIIILIIICMVITVVVFITVLSNASRTKSIEPQPTYYLRINEMNTRIGDTIYYEFTSDKEIMTLGTPKKQDGEYLIFIP